MSTIEVDDVPERFWRLPSEDLEKILTTLESRCKAAKIDIKVERDEEGNGDYNFYFKSGRDTRTVNIWDENDLLLLEKVEFEQYVFLSGLQAICNYEQGTIEAMVELAGPNRSVQAITQRLFGVPLRDARKQNLKLNVSVEDGDPLMEFGFPTDDFSVLVGGANTITLKVFGLKVRHHDEALNYITTVANSLLFQLDLMSDIPLVLKRVGSVHQRQSRLDKEAVLTYPKVEFDSAPLSLYWYGRGAVGMPLLQYLAFYQVIEFYFPRYSQSEAHRKLKRLLKNPAFRSDRDSDVAQLLDAIHVSKSGAYGDERSQLRAVIDECLFNDELKKFISENDKRMEFFAVKNKSIYHKINIMSEDDMRADVARRIYEIRCKIVHTKSDSRDVEVKILLPYSKEAEQLTFDIELIQYVARQVLIAGGSAIGKH